MKNEYEVRGDVTAIFINSPKFGLTETLIDTVDLPKMRDFPNTWRLLLDPDIKTFYVQGSLKNQSKRWGTIKLHRWITNVNKSQVVDHRNHDTLDNRRSVNLRVCTHGENQGNQRPRKGKSSRFKGVSWIKNTKKWSAQIGDLGKVKYLGNFVSEVEAALEYNKAAISKFGSFARLNDVHEEPCGRTV